MNIEQEVIAKKINILKGVVPKGTNLDLQGILYEDGYLIASDTRITLKAKIEGCEDKPFIIPIRAFDLISNLPKGEVEITCVKETVMIKTGKIKNQFKTLPPAKFIYNRKSIDAGKGEVIPADKMKEAISHAMYAVSKNESKSFMAGMYLQCSDNKLNFVGSDGYRIAWDCIEQSGDFKLIIPRMAMEKLLGLIEGDVHIFYDRLGVEFKTDDYEIYTRIIEGNFFDYRKMFSGGSIQTTVERELLLDAVNRARLCGNKDSLMDKTPIKFSLSGGSIETIYKGKTADYEEVVPVQVPFESNLLIGFNPNLLIDCLKSFSCESLSLTFESGNAPLIIKAEDSEMMALILPVKL